MSGPPVPPLWNPPICCLLFMGLHEKTISVNSPFLLFAIVNMSYKIVLGLRNSLYKFKLYGSIMRGSRNFESGGGEGRGDLKKC